MILFWTEEVKRKQKLLTDHKRNNTQNVVYKVAWKIPTLKQILAQ